MPCKWFYLPTILSPSLSSDDDVLDTVHEQLTINAAGMHGAEEVSCLVHNFNELISVMNGFCRLCMCVPTCKAVESWAGPGNEATAAWCCASVLGVPQC